MGVKQLSPFGCRDCIHAWVDRCGLTGHGMKYTINAKHHCKEFKRDSRVPVPDVARVSRR